MGWLTPSLRVRILSTASIFIAMVFSGSACFRDPDVGKIKCTKECPPGFACVNPDPTGPNGHCEPVRDGGTDLPWLVEGDGATPSGIDAVLLDGVRSDVVGPDTTRIETGLPGSSDASPIDGSLDLESGTGLGEDARETGSGGALGTGGVGGATGLGGLTGNRDAGSGGTLGSGGDTSPVDASINSGGAPGTGGIGAGTGGTGTGGIGTGGIGTGGSGTGGSGTGGSGTGGSGTGGSGTGGIGTGGIGTGGGGTGGGGSGGCQKGQVGASEVVFMGESFYALSPQYIQKRVQADAQAAGALAAIDSYRNAAVSGQLLSYIASTEWRSVSGAVKVVIMDGGAIDGASSPCDSCPGTFQTLLATMASNGVQDVIYTRYPELGNPPGTSPLKGNIDILMPQLQTVCEGATGLRCHWVDLRPVWVNGDTTDGFNPNQFGGNHVGDAIWAEMVRDCIAQ